MTAEIAVMNKLGVALAADSAVTIGDGTSNYKIYNSTNKLFQLSERCPIGVMIYGSATFMGIPWETIVKAYRAQNTGTPATVLEESAAFLSFIRESGWVPAHVQRQYFQAAYESLLQQRIKSPIDQEVELELKRSGKLGKRRLQSIVREIVTREHDEWQSLPDLADCPTLPSLRQWRDAANEVVDHVLQQLPVAAALRKRLLRLSELLFQKDRFFIEVSGIVVAGFGGGEMYPALVSYSVDSLIGNRLKFKRESYWKVSFQEVEPIDADATVTQSVILPFAQQEVVHSYIAGVHPAYRQMVSSYLEEFLNTLPDVVDALPLSPNNSDALKQIFKSGAEAVISEFTSRTDQFIQENMIGPIISATSFLPKDELAVMAETLVNLTSFRQKMSFSPETVGGPIDVAVISKGDGFIWIKRKHYFSSGDNPQFLARKLMGGA